jgi:4-amino-4-deoxy-L-arabinose transferase-like glycosyltransferase
VSDRLKRFFAPMPLGERAPRRIFWTALMVRLLYMTLAHTYRIRLTNDHFEFGWEMGRIARALATGYGFADPFNGHTGPTAWTPPLYPLLLAGVFKVFGVYTLRAAWVILAINSIFSAATAPAVYQIAWRSFGRNAEGMKLALWSAWLWALYPAAMQYAVRWVWDMSLTACLFAWVIVLALRLRESANATGWAGFGALWGLIALSNSALLTFLPACVLWMVWHRLRDAEMLRNVALAAACCAAIVSPWVVRNEAALHAFVPMRSNLGAELYESARLENEGYPSMASLAFATSDPRLERYRQLGEIAYSRRQGERAWAILRTHRAVFLQHMLKRVWFFWVSVPHPTEHGWKGIASETGREMSYAFLSLCGLFGLALALRHRVPAAWLFFWAFAIYPLLYYAVTVQARFRHPLEPLICVLGVYLFRSAQNGRRPTMPA